MLPCGPDGEDAAVRGAQCAEPQAEWVVDKERANFCEFFVFTRSGEAPRGASASRRSGRDQWDKLFRKP